MRLMLAIIILSVAFAAALPVPVTSADQWTPVASLYMPVVDQPWWNSVCSGMAVEELIVGGGFEVDHEANWIIEAGSRPECDPYVFMWNYHGMPYPRPHELRLQQCLDYEASVANAPLISAYARDEGHPGDLVAARLQYDWKPFGGDGEAHEPGDYFSMSLRACPDPPLCEQSSDKRIELDRQRLWNGVRGDHVTVDVTEALYEDIGTKRFEIMHVNDAEGHGSGAFIDNVSLRVCTRP